MASRRMKIKVSVNLGRPGRGSGRDSGSRTPVPESYQNLTCPGSPTKNIHHVLGQANTTKPNDLADVSATIPTQVTGEYQSAVETSQAPHLTSPASPRKPPMSPEYILPTMALDYAPKSPVKSRSHSPTKSPGPSLVHHPVSYDFQPKSPTKHHSKSSELRGPGRGPAANSTSNSAVLNNLQKEIGAANVANMNSNETLRQRLQKGTSLSTTKYATIRKEFLSKYPQCGNKQPDKSELTILHFTFWNPPSRGPEENLVDEKLAKEANMIRAFEENLASNVKTEESAGEAEEKKPMGPRVKVGPDGELILDEQSLVIETSESQRAKKQLSEMETVSGAGFSNGSSGYYRRKRGMKRSYDWSTKETVRFYRALTSCGTDFSMMQEIFSRRTRAELKAKFKREDRRNPALISQALSCQTFDPMEEFSSEEETEDKEEISLPLTKKARRNSIKEPVTVMEELSKVVGAKIVGDSPALEAYVRRRKKSEAEPKPPPFKRGRPGKFMNTQKFSFVPVFDTGSGNEFLDTESCGNESRETQSSVPQPDFLPAVLEIQKSKKALKQKRPKLLSEKAETEKPVKGISVSEKENPAVSSKSRKRKKITTELNPEAEPEQKKRKRTPKVKTPKAPRGKKAREVVIGDTCDSNPCPDILRFDPSDPLGHKIPVPPSPVALGIQNAAQPVEAEATPMHHDPMPYLVLVTSDPQRDLTSEAEAKAPDKEITSEPSIANTAAPSSSFNMTDVSSTKRKEHSSPVPAPQNARRSRITKIKPKLRVPTGGDMDKNRKLDTGSVADEIEIEISCQ